MRILLWSESSNFSNDKGSSLSLSSSFSDKDFFLVSDNDSVATLTNKAEVINGITEVVDKKSKQLSTPERKQFELGGSITNSVSTEKKRKKSRKRKKTKNKTRQKSKENIVYLPSKPVVGVSGSINSSFNSMQHWWISVMITYSMVLLCLTLAHWYQNWVKDYTPTYVILDHVINLVKELEEQVEMTSQSTNLLVKAQIRQIFEEVKTIDSAIDSMETSVKNVIIAQAKHQNDEKMRLDGIINQLKELEATNWLKQFTSKSSMIFVESQMNQKLQQIAKTAETKLDFVVTTIDQLVSAQTQLQQDMLKQFFVEIQNNLKYPSQEWKRDKSSSDKHTITNSANHHPHISTAAILKGLLFEVGYVARGILRFILFLCLLCFQALTFMFKCFECDANV